jgi:hypothetical protein
MEEYGIVEIKLFDSLGNAVLSQKWKLKSQPMVKKDFPVMLSQPKGSGGYTLVSEFSGKLNPVKIQKSRRYIKIGDANHTYFEASP